MNVCMTENLANRIEALLPQTQCTKCGYSSCRSYAVATNSGDAGINQCPPGGAEGIARLAALLGKPAVPLNPLYGTERSRQVALIDESLCIGCTLCIDSCPVDAIVGASKQMHSVLTEQCTGCDLCVAPCPVECITMTAARGDETGQIAWSSEQASAAGARHQFRIFRLQRDRDETNAQFAANAVEMRASLRDSVKPESAENDKTAEERKKAIIRVALQNARLKKEAMAAKSAIRIAATTTDADET